MRREATSPVYVAQDRGGQFVSRQDHATFTLGFDDNDSRPRFLCHQVVTEHPHGEPLAHVDQELEKGLGVVRLVKHLGAAIAPIEDVAAEIADRGAGRCVACGAG